MAVFILSRQNLKFTCRSEAGRLLADEIAKRSAEPVSVVLGIPRGGVVIASEIARTLGSAVDIVLSRKLRVPWQPELAFGAISEDGGVILNHSVIENTGLSQPVIDQEIAVQTGGIENQKTMFRQHNRKSTLSDKTVVITDDGVATGATFKAALATVRAESPKTVIAALPVAPENTLRSIDSLADLVICLNCPPDFSAVSQYYQDFSEVTNEEVIARLVD
ncbi:phosphoribosyltransferase [Dehalogenimonas lykanthroporepellens BL-DC-9]|jgi:predicted phosphoribosyltransferase|nr:phosphoribosyltransferase [Dehalogenimonas lykanthroporepellens BL-DC-9]